MEELLMDEELEETDKVMEPLVHSSSSSDNEDDTEKTEVTFRSTRAGDLSNFTGPSNGVNLSAASDINAESSPFSSFILFFRQIFQIILTETNYCFQQCMSCKIVEALQHNQLILQSKKCTCGWICTNVPAHCMNYTITMLRHYVRALQPRSAVARPPLA